MARVLVAGGAGFIGSHATSELLRRGHSVRVIDNVSTGSRENLAAVGGDAELMEGEIRSYERTYAATKGIDCVIHLAALPSVPRSIQDPLTTNEVDVTGTLNVVLAARDARTKRVIFGDGAQSRDFTYVDNVVEATLSASECRLDGPLICNVDCGSSHTVVALAKAAGRVAERAVRLQYVPARPGDVLQSYADTAVAQEALRYEPTVALEEGPKRTLVWMLAEKGT